MSKKLQEKQQRRLAEEAKKQEARRAARRRNLVTVGLAAVVTAGVVFLVINDRKANEAPQGVIGVSATEAGCTDAEEFDEQGRGHIEDGAPHDPYNSDPPTSGPHYAQPAPLGFYPVGSNLPPEQLIHNLEHGQIVIWYRPDISESSIDALEQIADKYAESTVVAPYSGIEVQFSYAVTGWTALEKCAQVSEAAINEFRKDYQGAAPEPFTPRFTEN